MGNSNSVPSHSPLGIILKHWSVFSSKHMSKKDMIFYCNYVWRFYSLESGEQWPKNGSLDYMTILQLQVYCKSKSRHLEVDYVNTFMALCHNVNLRNKYKCGGEAPSETVVTELRLREGQPRRAPPAPPTSIPGDVDAARTGPASETGTIPPEPRDVVAKSPPGPQRLPTSPSGAQQSVDMPQPGPQRLPTSPSSAQQSVDTPQPGPQRLPTSPSSAQQSVDIPQPRPQRLPTSPSSAQQSVDTPQPRPQRLPTSPSGAQQSVDTPQPGPQRLPTSPSRAQQSVDMPRPLPVSPCPSCTQLKSALALAERAKQTLPWGTPGMARSADLYKWRASGKNLFTSIVYSTFYPTRLDVCMVADRPLSGGEQFLTLQKALQEAVGITRNCDINRALEVHQCPSESPFAFLERISEALRKFTPVDPEDPDCARLVNMVFISHSAPDIRDKLQHLPAAEGYPTALLVNLANLVFKDRERVERVRKQRRLQRQRRRERQKRDAQIARAVQEDHCCCTPAPGLQWEPYAYCVQAFTQFS